MAAQFLGHYLEINGRPAPAYVYVGIRFEPHLPAPTGEVNGNRIPVLSPELPSMRIFYERCSYETFRWWFDWTGDLNGGVPVTSLTLPFPLANPGGARPFHATFSKAILCQPALVGGEMRLYASTRNVREHWHEGAVEIWIRELALNGDEW